METQNDFLLSFKAEHIAINNQKVKNTVIIIMNYYYYYHLISFTFSEEKRLEENKQQSVHCKILKTVS